MEAKKKQKCTGPAQIMLSGCTMPIRRHRTIHGFHHMMMMNVDIVGKGLTSSGDQEDRQAMIEEETEVGCRKESWF